MSGASDRHASGGLPRDAEVPLVAVVPWAEAAWAVVLHPGAGLAELLAVLATVPADATFTEAFGDVDVVLAFEAVG